MRRIYCVGRNYAEHAREMGADTREPPFFFTKFPDAIVESGGTCPYPPQTGALHHEGELVLAIGREVARDDPAAAREAILAFGAGLDLTRRDLQAVAKAQRQPWDMAKNFTGSAVLAPLRLVREGSPADGARIRLWVDGVLRQDGALSDMIWSPAQIVAHLARLDRLRPGDLIFTGTPAGVGPVRPGDRLRLEIDGLPVLDALIAAEGHGPGAAQG